MKDKKIANKKLINKPLYKITPIDLFLFSPFEDEIRGVIPYDKPIPNNKTKLKKPGLNTGRFFLPIHS